MGLRPGCPSRDMTALDAQARAAGAAAGLRNPRDKGGRHRTTEQTVFVPLNARRRTAALDRRHTTFQPQQLQEFRMQERAARPAK
jgi:hypothetical protein